MRSRLIARFAVMILAGAGALAMQAAQTTEDGRGPTEQPSAPMEMGRPQGSPRYDVPLPSQYAQPGYGLDHGLAPQMGTEYQGQYGRVDARGEAQPGGPSGEAPANVDQGVGRLSSIRGAVSTQRGDTGDWSAAVTNQPVFDGDKVSTGDDARTEVQLDYANIVRLGPNAQVNIGNFTQQKIQVQVAQGTVDYVVFGESEAEPEIDTPGVAIHPAHQHGAFRIEVRPDGDTTIIVRKGEAQISTPEGSEDLKEGDMATVRGSGADTRYNISAAPNPDDWDQWNTERDQIVHKANSWNHTNKYYVGSEDLDAKGSWQNADDYGQVWVPNEPEDWAPYRDGSWTYEPYYGWTWVGGEPWGWAPYHYGRWMMYGSSWAWWPGPVWGAETYRPFWSPAYVSFFGFGGGFGVGLGWGGWGSFGWLPLGPCDWFHPWWGGYGGRFGVVGYNRFGGSNRYGGFAPLHGGTRFSNVAHINDDRIARGLSTVGAHEFGHGRMPVVAASRAQIRGAHMMTGNVPVIPSRGSLSASGRTASPSTIHRGAAQRFSGAPLRERPGSFQQQTAGLQQSMRRNNFSPVAPGSRGWESRAGAGGSGSRGAGFQSGRSIGNPQTGSSSMRSSSQGRINANNGVRGSEYSGSQNQAGNRNRKPLSPQSSQPLRGPDSRGTGSWNRGGSSAQSSSRSQSGSYWNRTAPTSDYPRGSNSVSGGSRSYNPGGYSRGGESSRPQLNMRQPIVQPRSSGIYGGNNNGYRGNPKYGSSPSRAPAGHGSPGFTAPSYGGNHGGYSGGSHSAPSSGGGHSRGGSSFSGQGSGGGHTNSGGSGGGHVGGGGHSGGGSGGHHR